MKITNKELLKKRLKNIKINQKFTDKLIKTLNEFGVKDSEMRRYLNRQRECFTRLELYSNGVVRSWFCGLKTCLTCNSIRMVKFVKLYQPEVKQYKYASMLVLTMSSPYSSYIKNDLDKIIDFRKFLSVRVYDMFIFWHNSMMCKNALYKKLSKTVHVLRTWETTLKNKLTFHPHFHLLLVGNSKDEIETYGNIIMNYWVKWWERRKIRCTREAQKLEPLRSSIYEVMHYCMKPTDLKQASPLKILEMINTLKNRRAFNQRGFKSIKELEAINKKEITDIEHDKVNDINGATKINLFFYDHKLGGFYSKATGEVIE